MGIKPGQLGGRTKLTGVVDIVLLPTLARREPKDVTELTKDYGQVIVDECHHLGAATYDSSVKHIQAIWWLGLSATPVMLIQAAGRVLRTCEGKSSVIVHDYLDTQVPLLANQYLKRSAGYRQMGFTE